MVETVSAPSDKLSQRALAALGKLPPFSPILNKLLASLAGEDVSFAKLGDLIEKDTVVAGNILHLVNSALYARRATITSVRHALALLGMDKVRNTLLGMSISRMWSQVKTPAVWSMARFNRHSASVAVLGDQIASRLPVDYPEGAFVAGLLHDLGRLLIALGLPDEFARLVKLHEQSGRSWTECERELLGITHAELSATALATWNFPEQVQIAVRDHHQPPPFVTGGTVPLSAVVDAANQYVNSTGESIIAGKVAGAEHAGAIAALGIPEENVSRLLADFKAEHAAMAAFFK
ncbi:MAG: family phosphohydrolase [Bryobacterales bacterium]|jgi:HD-like signal output (HDOD) protein|nr:family phosphohydrolase [Bryobacterales bacterium]